MPIAPIKNQILAREITIPGGFEIQIPSDTKTPTKVCLVVDVGPGKYENGAYVPMEIAAGDYLLCGEYVGVRILISGVEHIIITSDDVMSLYDTP